jgi:hypothetical protein
MLDLMRFRILLICVSYQVHPVRWKALQQAVCAYTCTVCCCVLTHWRAGFGLPNSLAVVRKQTRWHLSSPCRLSWILNLRLRSTRTSPRLAAF